MAKYLVIVESPAKVKTIKKFLGKNYEVAASNGHVRDLPKSQLGFDVENDFEPKDILANLRKEVKKADKVYLATDPDREGEAISWHLATALKLNDKDAKRITFNEITKNAVKASLKNPREIDMNLVDAQQARRVLDRMVGYKISPVLWAKVKRGLSAGRVQSVALRIICDREDEINAFIPEEYWTIDAVLNVKGEKKPLVAKFYGDENGKILLDKKGNPVIDKERSGDTEIIPFTYEGGIDAFIQNEVHPYAPDAFVKPGSEKVGYELSFTKYFYKPVQLRTLDEIAADIRAIEKETDGLLDEIIGG